MSPPVRTAIISDSLLVVGKMTALDQQTNAQPHPWQARASRPPLLSQDGCPRHPGPRPSHVEVPDARTLFLRFSLFFCAH